MGHKKYSETSLIRTSEIRAPPSTRQPSRAILLIKSPEVGVVISVGVTCYSISYALLNYGHPPIPGAAWIREVSL